MLRVATVLSAREWESRLVAAARDTAMVKLVLRAFVPDEVSRHAAGIDVVVAGSETPWVTPTRVASWRRLGLRVVGIHPRSDRPAADRLRAGGADLLLTDDLDADTLVREIRVLGVDGTTPTTRRSGRVTAVTGVHGAPGISEIAVALAWNEAGRGDVVLIDGDLAAPSLAIRLGLAPRPDIADVIDRSLGEAAPPLDELQRVGGMIVVPGAMRQADTGVRSDLVMDIADGIAATHSVVVDCGRWPASGPLVQAADRVVLVVGPTPVSIVRLARAAEAWVGPQPLLVVNGVTAARRLDVVAAVRRWSGLEPAVVVHRNRRIAAAGAVGGDPARALRRRLAAVGAAA